jgi:hypothetical protein
MGDEAEAQRSKGSAQSNTDGHTKTRKASL